MLYVVRGPISHMPEVEAERGHGLVGGGSGREVPVRGGYNTSDCRGIGPRGGRGREGI